MKIFYLPDLGEGLPDAEIVEWHVKPGDSIELDQLLVSMETAKAVVEVPSPYAGQVIQLHGQPGTVIETGKPLASFEVAMPDQGTVVGKVEQGDRVVQEQPMGVSQRSPGIKVLPAVRALAKKLKVDLTQIVPTGKNQLVTAEDVKRAHSALTEAGPLQALRGARRSMAQAMQQAHSEVVPVTIYDEVDISEWLTNDYTIRALQAMAAAAAAEPALNIWYDGQAMGRRLLKSVDIGIAMDSAEGLLVPVLPQVEQKTAAELRHTLNELKHKVQQRTIAPEQLQGQSISLSNFGKFAGRYATPIVIPPSVAILGVGVWYEAVKPIQGEIQIRKMLPLSLSFDHRAVTGGEATRFLAALIQHLAQAVV
jgi:pyruvate dehydrogenase E2 component (dihydrolipoamide acetyltransferase)